MKEDEVIHHVGVTDYQEEVLNVSHDTADTSQSNDSKFDTVIEQHGREPDSHEDTRVDCSESSSGAIDRMVNEYESHQDRDGHNESRNSKYYKVFLDRKGGDRHLIGITDDYTVKVV